MKNIWIKISWLKFLTLGIVWITRIKQLLLNNIWFVPGITFAYGFSQFTGWVFKEVCGPYFHVGVYPLPSPWFCKFPKYECIRSNSLAVHETATCKKKTVTALFLIAEFKPMQLFVLLGIKPSLFCATTSAEKLGMHMDLLYHLYCWERELLSFTVHDCWN